MVNRTIIGHESEMISSGEIYSSDKIMRITADIDSLNINLLISCLKTFKKYGFTKDLLIRKSSSGKGYHVIAWSENKGVSKKKLLKIRKKAGDDTIRIMLDNKTGRQIQVLFTEKGVMQNE